MRKMAGFVALVLAASCLPADDDDDRRGPPPECTVDADCAHLDTDTDECTFVKCEANKCAPRIRTNSTSCQCATDADCARVLGGGTKDCATPRCSAYKCSLVTAPAGPSPNERAGDCQKLTCDGVSQDAKREPDLADVGEVKDPCQEAKCTANGVRTTTERPDGSDCGDGVCFQAKCIACKAQNASSCAKEGPNEPSNDNATSPAAFAEKNPICGFSGGDDVDWYTFFAKDKDLTTEIMRFHFWSSAPTLEACIYVKCEGGGNPGGGCADMKDGPNGSKGCCYSGAAGSVKPVWDLDCAGTTEDSGNVYISVRTIGGTTCERYTMNGGY